MPESPANHTGNASESLLQRGHRLGGHLVWYTLEIGVNMGMLPVVILPACLHFAGPEAFGQFLYALGIVNLVGLAPVKGLNNSLLRTLANLEPPTQRVLVRTSFAMAGVVVAGLAVLGLLACWAGWSRESQSAAGWIALLILAFATRNMLTVGTVDFVVRRRFAYRAIWRSLGSIFALVCVPAYLLYGPVGFPTGYAAGHVAALVALLIFRRSALLASPRFDRTLARDASASWFVLSLSTFFITSGRYVHRTVLGTTDTMDTVGVFGAGASALDLLVMPVSALGLFGFQLLAAHASMDRFSRGFLARYIVASLVGVVVFFGVCHWVAPIVVTFLYGPVAEDAMQPMRIMAVGVAATVLMHAARPFVQRFASTKALLLIGVASVVAHLGLALWLIPSRGLLGAAWAFCIANIITSVVWFACLVTIKAGSADDGDATVSP